VGLRLLPIKKAAWLATENAGDSLTRWAWIIACPDEDDGAGHPAVRDVANKQEAV